MLQAHPVGVLLEVILSSSQRRNELRHPGSRGRWQLAPSLDPLTGQQIHLRPLVVVLWIYRLHGDINPHTGFPNPLHHINPRRAVSTSVVHEADFSFEVIHYPRSLGATFSAV